MALLIPCPPRRPIRSRHWFRGGLAALALGFSAVPKLPAQTAVAREYQLKAVFLYNFTQFVEWPPQSFPESQTPLVIGILGDDPFGPYLDEAVRGERANNHPLVIQHYRRVDEIAACHVLFISRSEAARLEQIISGLKERAILTVGDAEDFARRGGMIRFVMEKSHLRLKINLEAARAASLTISSKLLRPAEIVSLRKD